VALGAQGFGDLLEEGPAGELLHLGEEFGLGPAAASAFGRGARLGACGWGKAPPGVIWTRAVAMYSAGRRKFHNRPGMSTSAKTSRKTRSRRRLLRRVAASPSRSGVTSSSR
jgi:hypothetical protein